MAEGKARSITQEPLPKTLDYVVKARNGKKRDYIFGVSKTRTCTHPELREVVTGAGWYRCTRCNYVQFIVSSYGMALHHLAKLSIQTAFAFAKEFGGNALEEVLRTPSGQHELDYQIAALPDGKDIKETLDLFDGIDVTVPDGGKRQLMEMYDKHFVSPAERERRLHELKSANPALGKLLARKGLMAAMEESKRGKRAYERAVGRGDSVKKLSERPQMPSLSRGKGTSHQDRDQGQP